MGKILDVEEFLSWLNDADEDCRWIPVTERLPEDESDVLTTIASKSGNGYREYSVGCYIKVFDEDEEKHWLDRQYGYLEWDTQTDTVDAHCTELQHGCRFRICTRDKDHEQTRERGSGAD